MSVFVDDDGAFLSIHIKDHVIIFINVIKTFL